jgi:hypothetical protein
MACDLSVKTHTCTGQFIWEALVVGREKKGQKHLEHMIKARAHKGGVRIGKTPKKLASICCP